MGWPHWTVAVYVQTSAYQELNEKQDMKGSEELATSAWTYVYAMNIVEARRERVMSDAPADCLQSSSCGSMVCKSCQTVSRPKSD